MEPEDVLTRPAELPDAVLRYAAHRDGMVDVFLPPDDGDATPPPLVVVLHGGFWRAAYDRRHTRPLALALSREGYVVATPEYRRVGDAGPDAGSWPETLTDVSTAMAALPEMLQGAGLPTGRITVVGHSAGGHLALWIANEGHPLDRVVGLAPVADLRAAARAGLGDGATQAFLGGTPDQVPDAYAAADPMTRFVDPPTCEVVLVHGVKDLVVPVEQSRALAARHRFVRLHELEGIAHYALIDPLSAAWPAVLAAVRP